MIPTFVIFYKTEKKSHQMRQRTWYLMETYLRRFFTQPLPPVPRRPCRLLTEKPDPISQKIPILQSIRLSIYSKFKIISVLRETVCCCSMPKPLFNLFQSIQGICRLSSRLMTYVITSFIFQGYFTQTKVVFSFFQRKTVKLLWWDNGFT